MVSLAVCCHKLKLIYQKLFSSFLNTSYHPHLRKPKQKKPGICTTISFPNNTAAIPKWSTITKANSTSKNKEIPVSAYIWNAAFYLTLPIELNSVLLTLPFPGKAQCISNWFTLITHFVLGFANSSPRAAHNFSPLLTNGSRLTPINPTWSLSSISIIIPPNRVGEMLPALH